MGWGTESLSATLGTMDIVHTEGSVKPLFGPCVWLVPIRQTENLKVVVRFHESPQRLIWANG